MEILIFAVKILGTLGLLIFGMKTMSDSLQQMAGRHLRHILGAMTSNRFTGILTGAFITSAVQSSSATTVMTVSFVNAGLLTLAQAISVVMGANIGTTLTAWIISLGYNVDLYTIIYPSFLIGVIFIYIKRHRFFGNFLFGAAFMFLSLIMLNVIAKEMDLANNQSVVEFFSGFDTQSYFSIIVFVLIGTVITCIAQSSAAVMAVTIMLCSTGVLPIHLGIALVMGENIGTTATANLAALAANTQARRTAMAHLIFNVFGVIWVLFAFYPFTNMVCRLAGVDPEAKTFTNLPVVLAMFHTCFNVANTLILVWFVPKIEQLVTIILPEKNKGNQEEFRLEYIQSGIIKTPEISVLQAQKETTNFALRLRTMFDNVRQLSVVKSDDEFEKLFAEIEKMEDFCDKTEIEIARYLELLSDNHLSDETKEKVRRLLREISELESIADSCYNQARALRRKKSSGKDFNDHQYSQLSEMMTLAEAAINQMIKTIKGRKAEQKIDETFRIENEINALRKRLKQDSIRSIEEKEYGYEIGTIFIDIINECEKLGDYVVNVVQARLGK